MTMMPEQGPIDAAQDFNWPMLIALIWLLPLAAGIQESVPMLALSISAFFTAFLIALQMWMPI